VLKQKNLSIVIPSLGGLKLQSSLHFIHKSKIRPLETIICIPKSYKEKIRIPQKLNPKLIKTNNKGQVYQRLIGFKKARGKYVLQLDDDIKITSYCLNKLLKEITKNNKISISPLLIDKNNKESLFDIKPKNYLFKIYHYLLNGKQGYKHGIINKAGIPYMFEKKKKIYEVEWLPGGCVLHYRKNLIKKNYFRFNSNKAFCEDLFHSYHLRKKKIKLFVNTSIKCNFESFKGFKTLKFCDSLNLLFQDLKIRFFFVKLTKKSIYRMLIYYFILFCRLNYIFLKKILI
jgi:glycosyltransferase involved in cell wall biosynthesis